MSKKFGFLSFRPPQVCADLHIFADFGVQFGVWSRPPQQDSHRQLFFPGHAFRRGGKISEKVSILAMSAWAFS